MELRLQNLTKHFGDRLAVDIPSLTIAPGEFFTFVGPSGCGKSTTLNLIAGLESPSGGELRIDGRLLNLLPPHKRDIAFVFQSYALYPHRTVAENLAFPLKMAKMPRPEIEQRVEDAAAALGLTPLLKKYPRQLSGGERQRVAVGRAIVRKPALFLFDEPLSNLDAPLRVHTRKELRRLHQRLGTTFLYVTHDQEEALSLSDRIAVMQAGRIQQCASPEEIYYRPANRFVGAFFGSPPMNFLDGTFFHKDGEPGVHLGGIPIRLKKGLPGRDGSAVTVGVRPEDLRISRSPAEDAWEGRVSLTELHGGQSYLEVAAGGSSLTAVSPATEGFRSGETVWVKPARLHLFDPRTEERVPLSGDPG